MKLSDVKRDNRGFSLVELIVIMAIMTVTVGALALSISLISGSEAKEAARKFNAQIDEARTGSMSRYDEDLTIKYMEKDTDNGIDTPGFYTVKEITTIEHDTSKRTDPTDTSLIGSYKAKVIGSEHRYLSKDRVKISVEFYNGSEVVTKPVEPNTAGNDLTLKFDRTTGLLDKFLYAGTAYNASNLKAVYFETSIRKFRITFVQETGKHQLDTVNNS